MTTGGEASFKSLVAPSPGGKNLFFAQKGFSHFESFGAHQKKITILFQVVEPQPS
jgi:hypothetical protein